jgi:hypothetical protein
MSDSSEEPVRSLSFDFVLANIGALTAIVTLFLAASATCFLFGYLAAFDRQLPKLVQYSDVLQFAVNVLWLELLLDYLLFSFVAAEIIRRIRQPFVRPTARTGFAILLIGLLVIAEFRTPRLQDLYSLAGMAALLFVITVVAFKKEAALRLPWIAILPVVSLTSFIWFGNGWGVALRNSDGTLAYLVTLKDKSALSNVRFVAFLARGLVVYDPKADHVTVIPEDFIERMEPAAINRL